MRAFLVGTFLMAILAGSARAQVQRSWALMLDGELEFPISGPSGFVDKYESMSLGAGAGLGAILSEQVMVFGQFSYTKLPVDEAGFREYENLPDDTAIDGGDIVLIYVSAGVRYYPFGRPFPHTHPYVVGGAGWYHVASDTLTATSPVLGTEIDTGGSENAFGLNVGVGSDFAITETVSAFFEAQYQVGFTSGSKTATLPVRVGFVFVLGRIE